MNLIARGVTFSVHLLALIVTFALLLFNLSESKAGKLDFPVPPPDLNPYELKVGEKPLPEPKVVYSQSPTLDSMYRRIYTSYPYVTNFPSIMSTGVDLNRAEIEEYRAALSSPDVAQDLKNMALVFNRYRIGDPRFTDMILEAAQKGVGTLIVGTDLNESMEAIFPPGINRTSDFQNKEMVFLKTNDEATAIKKLIEAGFVICGSQMQFNEVVLATPPTKQLKVIFSQPIYKDRPGRSKPIQHEKQGGLFIIKRNKAAFKFIRGLVSTSSSHNQTMPPNGKINSQGDAEPFYRANVLESFMDQNVMAHVFDHLIMMARGLGSGREIKDVDTISPVQIVAKNGEILSIYHTDGRFNPNHFDTALFQTGTSDPKNYTFKEIYYSQFVYTFGESLSALRALMKAQPQTQVSGIFDSQFISSHGFGVAPALAGYLVVRPFGNPVFPFSFESRKNIKVLGYQRVADGMKIEDVDGPPAAVVLNHNKFMAVRLDIKGQPRTIFASGSLNLSGHFENAERRDLHLAGEDSLVAKAMIESVTAMMVDAQKLNHALPLYLAVFRLAMADLLKRSFDDIPVSEAQNWYQRLSKDRDQDDIYLEFEKAILKLEEAPTSVKNKASREQVQATMAKLRGFAEWYRKTLGQGLYVSDLVSIAVPIVYPDTPSGTVRSVISFVVNRPYGKVSPEELESRLKRAWVELGLSGEPPVPWHTLETGLIRTPTPSEYNPRMLKLEPLCKERLAEITLSFGRLK